MEKQVAIVVQGAITQMEYDFIRNAWGDKQLIISTWKGCVAQFNPTDIVIYNPIPQVAGTHNFNLQKKSTMAGLEKAKELGYDLALKIRCDMYPTNAQALLDCMDWDKLNFLAWHNHKEGYVTDYIIAGDIYEMLRIYDVNPNGPYPEWMLTNKLFNIDLSHKTNYFLDSINKDNDVYWNHKGQFKRLSDYHNIPAYTIKQPTQWI